MVRRTMLVALAALTAACVWTGTGDRRGLPADRSAPVVYVALGDSTVEGIGATTPEANYVSRLWARLRTVYPNARVKNLGAGGATSADVLARQLEHAVALRPNLVTLSIGPNDITKGVRAREYEDNLDAVFRRLATATQAVVVANLIPDLAVTPRFRGREQQAAVARLAVRFNDALARKGREWGVELVDLYGPSREEVPRRPELIAADGYHPSDAGYARWAELVWQGVERRLAAR